MPDYVGLLANVGVPMRRASPGFATVGRSTLWSGRDGVEAAAVFVGTPLYAAGIDDGDVITSLDVVLVTFEFRGRLSDSALAFAEDATLEVLTYEEAGLEVTDTMRALRNDWLGSKAGAERRYPVWRERVPRPRF